MELQRERTWQPLPARELRQVTVGVVGLGSIGRAVARLAAGLRGARHRHAQGARVLSASDWSANPSRTAWRGPAASSRWPAGRAESDFVVLALPLTAETEKLQWNAP